MKTKTQFIALAATLVIGLSSSLAQVPIVQTPGNAPIAIQASNHRVPPPIIRAVPSNQESVLQPGIPQAMPEAEVNSHYPAPGMAVECDCMQPNCRQCRLRRDRDHRLFGGCQSCGSDCGSVQCPECECEICKLELEQIKVKKTLFSVEPATVCIPKVRMPWQTCCPPGTSRTRTVNKLKTETIECPKCAYKWSLVKPESATAAKAQSADSTQQARAAEPAPPAAPIFKNALRFLPRVSRQ